MKTILLSSTFLFAVAGSAIAADAIVYEPTPEIAPAGFVWTGGYVGLQAGYAWGSSPFENRWGEEIDNYTERTDYDPDGAFGGVYVGYNHQLGNNVVLGVDADINAANLTGGGGAYTWSSLAGGSGEYDNVEASSRMKWNGAVRGRVGYAYDRFLPYIAGGVSFGQYEFDAINKDTDNVIFSEKETMTGWNIGGGLEYAATDSLIVRAEYRYTDFGSKTYPGLPDSDTAKIKLTTHDIRLGIAYKF